MTLPKTQEELDALINRVLAPKLSQITDLEGQVETLTSERDEAVTKVTAADDTITKLTGDVEASKRALLVKDVAHKKGVRERWLSGDTEEELIASADEYLADAKATLGVQEPPNEGGIGTVQEEPPALAPGSGVVPSAGTGDELPAKPTYQERLKEAYENARKEGVEGVTI